MRQNESARPTRDEAGTITETAPRNSQPDSNTRRDIAAIPVVAQALARRLSRGCGAGWEGERRAAGIVRQALSAVQCQGRDAQVVTLARALVLLTTAASASNITTTDVAGGGDVE